MKQLFLIVSILVMGSVFTVEAGNQQEKSLLEKGIRMLEQAESGADWKKVRSHFERITSVDPNDWLPLYYLTYVDIELSFRTADKKEKQQYLEESEELLEKLRKMKRTEAKERSEISTLRGYWCFAQMALNPAVNGPKYAGLITNNYSEALKLWPDNPRALLLNAWFQQQMASFMGGSYDKLEEEIAKANALFEKEDKNSTQPHWMIKVVSQ